MLTTFLAAVWLFAQAVPEAARSVAPTPPTQAAEKKAEADPVICRSTVQIGSRLPKRVCLTRSAMEEAQRRGRRITEDIQTRGKGAYASPQ